MKKKDFGTLLTGMALGAVLTGGAMAAGVTAEPAWSPIYVDGQQVQMTAYNILGNNYVKLRDIGKEVGFNVYYQNGVQVDSQSPYTGEAPVNTASQPDSSRTGALSVSSHKGDALSVGDRSMVVVSPYGTNVTAVSSNPGVIALEQTLGNYVMVVKAPGTAVISVTDEAGNQANLTFPLTVDFSGGKYWIKGKGPYLCGEAATAFLAGEIRCEPTGNTSHLTQELEAVLKTFGNHLSPFSEKQKTTDDLFQQWEQSAATRSVNYAFLPIQGSIVLAERYTFLTLRVFLYVELGRAILHGNAPRQCRLCGG